MQIHIDLSIIPPAITLRDPDDFTRFSVRVSSAGATYVGRDALEALAGERSADPTWHAELEKMLDYARSKGWVRDDGAIQAHVEWGS